MRTWTVVVMAAVPMLAACGSDTPSPQEVVGAYAAEVAGGAGPARTVTLELLEGNAADMKVATPESPPVSETGTWSLTPDGEVRVVLARDMFGPVSSDMTFRWARGTLTAVAFDTVRWGGRGFALTRQ